MAAGVGIQIPLEMLVPEADLFAQEYTQAYLDQVRLSTEGHAIEEDTAVVQVFIKWPDLEILMGPFFGEALGLALAAPWGWAIDEKIDALQGPVLLEALEDDPGCQNPS